MAAIKLDMALWGLAQPPFPPVCTSREIWQRLYESLQFTHRHARPGPDLLTSVQVDCYWCVRRWGIRYNVLKARQHMWRTSVLLTLEIHTASCSCGVQPPPSYPVWQQCGRLMRREQTVKILKLPSPLFLCTVISWSKVWVGQNANWGNIIATFIA